ncbi:hypothetical protein DICVIV_08081 [Dictyocaulus viviparus]|uniref:G-protein coupled receptors family 1 profile domain-containing protein n=1 Tax=Dictyocaulus viviparus TaxID=29172 RepID=A0A0D8XMK1_DICVI|nr:hypothetical protein DICVIV_08081 [Dictyocaulus viviparus]
MNSNFNLMTSSITAHTPLLVIQLTIAKLIYSLGSIYTSSDKVYIFSKVLNSRKYSLKTTVSCIFHIGLQMKTCGLIVQSVAHRSGDVRGEDLSHGNIFIPLTILWMGIERLISIMFPLFYRVRVDGKPLRYFSAFLSGIVVLIIFIFALLRAYNINNPTILHCGRQLTYGKSIAAFIYSVNICCTTASTLLSALAYVKAKTMIRKKSRQKVIQLDVIRFYLLISLLSTLLICIPSGKSMYMAYGGEVHVAISRSLDWLQTFNSGIDFFVYILSNKEIRQRGLYLLQKSKSIKKRVRIACGQNSPQPLFVSKTTTQFPVSS